MKQTECSETLLASMKARVDRMKAGGTNYLDEGSWGVADHAWCVMDAVLRHLDHSLSKPVTEPKGESPEAKEARAKAETVRREKRVALCKLVQPLCGPWPAQARRGILETRGILPVLPKSGGRKLADYDDD